MKGSFSWWVPALLALLAWGAYGHTLDVPFYYDDLPNIRENVHIRIGTLASDELRDAAFRSHIARRPLANLSFALNYAVGGYEVAGYHLVNIAIHFVTGLLAFFLLRATCQMPSVAGSMGRPDLIALFATLLWFAHPIQTQSVTYIVQRMNSLAALFYVLCLLGYVQGRRAQKGVGKWAWFAGSLLAALAALASKEIAVTIPFFLLVYEWFFFQDLDRAWLKRGLVCLVGALSLLGLAVFFYLGAHPWEAIGADYGHRDFSPGQRVLTQFPVVLYYISLLFYPNPSRLNLDHDFPLSNTLFHPPWTLASVVLVMGLAGLGVFLARKERLIAFSILWFLGNLVLESSVLGLEMVYEHRLYLPSLFFFVPVLVLCDRFVRRDWAVVAVTATVVALLSVWTFQRNSLWRDPVVFWADSSRKSANKARPHNNLGLALAEVGRLEDAISEYERALAIDPGFAKGHNNLGNALAAVGRMEEAEASYRTAVRLDPGYAKAHNNLGVALAQMGRFDGAIRQYENAIRLEPRYASARNNLGVALAEKGRFEEAEHQYRRALAEEPDHKDEILNNLGTALASQQRMEEAVSVFGRVLEIEPDHVEARHNLGSARALQGQVHEAIAHYEEALKIQPGYAPARFSLAMAYLSIGARESALREYRLLQRMDEHFAGILEEELRRAGVSVR